MPLVRGGAEILVRALVDQLRQRGYLADLVSVPFKWYPKNEILAHAAAWRLLDLGESNGTPIDLAIVTKFPTYCVRHPRKVAWLMHQYRAAYELVGTPFSDFSHDEYDVGLRQQLLDLDTAALGECRQLFAIARNTASRLEKYNGLRAEALYHPPLLAPRLTGGPAGDYVLSVGRLETIKRVDLIVRALPLLPDRLRVVVAGDGTQRANLERLADELGVAHRVRFLGPVDDDTLVGLYREALAVVFPPFDEDYGYVTLEAFLSHKPVVTTRDAGGPLEFVVHGENGFISEPAPAELAAAIATLDADRARTAALGDAGFERARLITWDGVVEALVGGAEA